MVGVVTVDDVLEAALPDDWRRREPRSRPTPARQRAMSRGPAT